MSPPPANHQVTWDKKPLFGPGRELPQSIADFVEQWHQLNPKEKGRPRFGYQPSSAHPSRTFDRQGNEVDVSLFRITRPLPYTVLIMYPVSGPPRLVSSIFPFGTNLGSFLRGWPLDATQEPDAEPCAVRVFGPAENKITYNPDTWEKMKTELMPRLRRYQATKAKAKSGQLPPSPEQQQPSDLSMRSRAAKRKSDGEAVQTPAAATSAATPFAAAPKTPATAPARTAQAATATKALDATDFSESEADSGSSEEGSSGSDDESGDEEEEDSDSDSSQDEHPAKRLKPDTSTPSFPSKPAIFTPLEVFFELVYYRIDGSSESCCFPLAACRSVVDLFQRAKAFIPSSLDEVNWKILRCEIPDEPPLDIFDKCDWEFERLVERTKSIPRGTGPLYIKVKAKLL